MGRIICDSYNRDKKIWGDNPNDDFNQRILAVNNMYGWLCDKGILKNISFVFKEFPEGFCFAFDANELAAYRNEMENSGVDGAAIAVRHIFDEEYSPCMYSGAIQLGWTMFTYRDVDGCVGRSWECDLIKGLNTRAIYDVNKIKDEMGVKEAVNVLFDYYIWNEKVNEGTENHSLDKKIQSANNRTDPRGSSFDKNLSEPEL